MQRLSNLAISTFRGGARFPRTNTHRSLKTYTDKWNCLQIKINENDNIENLDLDDLIDQAKSDCPDLKAAWLHADGQPALIPTAFQAGFKFHVAHDDRFVMYNWLKEGQDSTLPPPLTHQVGVCGFILNAKKQVLIIKDKGTQLFYGDYWKLPGGRVDLYEPISKAAEREILEECGVTCEFKSVLGFRETLKHPNVHLERADIFFITRLELKNPEEDTINFCKQELVDAAWVDLKDIGSEKYPVSPVFWAIMSVVDDGMEDWDKVDITRKSFEMGIGKTEQEKKRTFSFYRR